MQSTMMNVSLTTAAILRHGASVHGSASVRTLQADGTVKVGTFADVARRSAQLANALRKRGINSDERVATFMWNNQEHVEAYCAVPSMGAVLHTLNPRLTTEQLAYIANHAEDQVIIVDDSLVPLLVPVLPQISSLHTVVVTGDADLAPLRRDGVTVVSYEEFLSAQPETFDWPDIDEHSAAAMCYTSGTTGNPKGVAYSHRSTYLHSMAACAADGLRVTSDDRVLAIVPMFHANAWGLVYAALMAGADLLMPERFLQAEPLVRLIDAQKPTIAGAVPTIWNDVLNFLETNPGHDVSSLGLVACGGSAVPLHLMQIFEEKYGIQIVQAWGMTETSPLAAIARPPVSLEAQERWRLRATQGRPVAGVELRLVDDEGNELPHDGNAVGELQVRGPWITGAYFGEEDGGEKFQDGWLRTGDVGRIDARSFVTLTDRTKDVIKSGGEWISSVELELLLAGHPDVFEASVIAVPDAKWQERPLAVIVVREGRQVTPNQLRDFLEGKVARWWLPERWCFLSEVPKTSVGKFDKKRLRSLHTDGELAVIEI
ncbi:MULTISPECIES: long-chain fatty acid--CoA ligase [Nocardia]|uniref:long-chain fatty acid--CoA ligase n=1 Tax=Nocardia TaxID=1817 RepID=UPI0007E9E5B4|nr:MULTISPECIES: long-chain fatty acid--CoA ligase [Nocardia]MBF6278390.1 long-chain fatty acid--CoA ligase [Nocardia nova]OBA47866.1 long-chain fatty acid--CoA ligase [Nocardia sp. 852002-51101_SCH5132738]OBB30235.1 long-chain fatty acid--CoA ligase [Nocardia sp. 852002-51244_SCH5132740]OBF68023.1 long-chain fatty acid--CoA ligase [Mycobacterium sp. 852002-51759_SCH5129042]